jgi:nitrogen fixation protein FixH
MPTNLPRRKRSLIPLFFALPTLAVIVANAALIWFATHSATGLVTEHPFEKGLAYNEELARGAAQDALGWSAEVEYGADRLVVFQARDRNGAPVDGLAVRARFVRPVEPAPEVESMLAASGHGRYAATVELPRQGQWEIDVEATRGRESFVLRQRVFVP